MTKGIVLAYAAVLIHTARSRLNAKYLVGFDLDGTLLRGPTVCEALAAAAGTSDRMAEIERAQITMTPSERRNTRQEMASWYEALSDEDIDGALGSLQLAPETQSGLDILRDAGARLAIVSITWGFAVERFARLLNVDHWIGTELRPDGTITHMWPTSKGTWLRSLADKYGLKRSQLAAVGDSQNDSAMLTSCAVRVYVGEEPPAIAATTHMPHASIRDVALRVTTALMGGG